MSGEGSGFGEGGSFGGGFGSFAFDVGFGTLGQGDAAVGFGKSAREAGDFAGGFYFDVSHGLLRWCGGRLVRWGFFGFGFGFFGWLGFGLFGWWRRDVAAADHGYGLLVFHGITGGSFFDQRGSSIWGS
ncbi:hypothetical protein ES703_64866 [subsurface metagenome]